MLLEDTDEPDIDEGSDHAVLVFVRLCSSLAACDTFHRILLGHHSRHGTLLG